LYDRNGLLEPRRYSSGKTQVDLIEEILEAFDESGIVFLKGTVGSGKSVIGIRTILELGRGIVSVPTKVLSDQYAASYERDKYFLKEDGSRAKIGILKGRRNFACVFNAEKGRKTSCASSTLPCTRPLNKEAEERRVDAVQQCPHWGFVFHSGWAGSIKDALKLPYEGIAGKWIWCMKGECPYWKQFQAYVSSDAIVMNSMKWAAEVSIGRLPRVSITVIDEGDEWLDSLAVKVILTQKRIDWARERIRQDEELGEKLRKMWAGTLEGKENPLEMAGFLSEVLEEIDETSGDLYWRLKSLLEHRDHAEFEVREKSVVYFIPDPKIVLNRLLNKVGGKFLLMSATCQSPGVLENVFGIEPIFVEGETKFPGQLIQRRFGQEEVVNYRKWADEKFRRMYWNLLSRIMRRAKRPSFVPVHAFKYLPQKLREEISAEGIEVYKHQGIVFTTKMDRGADLKGMKSIIITKFPYPEREDPLLKGMGRRLGKEAFWDYYRDMAERNFVQQVGRVLRSDEDVVEFWSPDEACHAGLRSWKGSILREAVEEGGPDVPSEG
jgi:Rad3-related DNA helicase